jgi:hypothetical protein
VETHAPYEENHRWEEHDVEDKVFVHFFLKSHRAKSIAHRVIIPNPK